MAPANVRGPLDCGPQPAKDQCPELAGQRPPTRRSVRGVRERAVTDPKLPQAVDSEVTAME